MDYGLKEERKLSQRAKDLFNKKRDYSLNMAEEEGIKMIVGFFWYH